MLEDGTYDAFVVDATTEPSEPGRTDALRLDLTILTGPHKGEVVSMRAVGLGIDELDALGTPAILTVRDGEPTVVVDR